MTACSWFFRCGEDIKSLQRFVDAQRMAFHKILKKYKVRVAFELLGTIKHNKMLTSFCQKWTGSRSLGERFNSEVLSSPKSFTKRDFETLLSQYNHLLANLRASTPDISEPSTPRQTSRRTSVQAQVQSAPQTYWNEYDDGSEAENEPYTIYINPDVDSKFPGFQTVEFFISKAKVPMEKIKAWFSPTSSPRERRPLIGDLTNGGYFPEQTETDADDEAYASSSDFPAGYSTHYATFPSISDQKLSRHHEQLLFQGTIASFAAAMALLLIASILVTTGKHKLRIEVDAGVIVGVVGSLFFATLGVGTMLYRQERLSWLHRTCVGVTFVAVCVFNGMLLVLVSGNTGL